MLNLEKAAIWIGIDNRSLNLNELYWSTGDTGMRERMIPTNVVVHFWQRERTK